MKEPERDADGQQTRRRGRTLLVEHPPRSGLKYPITYNENPDTGALFECFYAPTDKAPVKEGSELANVIKDACILISLLHQRGGMAFSEIADALGENRAPGEPSGPPASVLGAIARTGAEMEE